MSSNISSIETIQRYSDNRDKIEPLLASIMDALLDPDLLKDSDSQQETIDSMSKTYPYLEMIYSLSETGEQLLDTTLSPRCKRKLKLLSDKNKDRSKRPYFINAEKEKNPFVTEPYLSITDGNLVVSATRKILFKDGKVKGYMVCDFNLTLLVSYFMGDARRNTFIPWFNGIYTIISVGLLMVMAMLLFAAFKEITHFFQDINSSSLRPFTAIIFFTLALSIFDLAKTVLEEEVLMHKDIFRHSSTRRTITRFISAILIAVSIEALLLMFKSTLGDGKHLIEAVWMMLAAVGLLAGLGFYVYMGAKAERLLTKSKQDERLNRLR